MENTVKLGSNDHGYSEQQLRFGAASFANEISCLQQTTMFKFTAITNKII